ncbi:TIP41-like protein [Lolium perenne]|uniref:TIP41-like protein n=1 Tax=Lolium perenne TaxID=4522 RepID=UPI0021F621FB|nr:TIP41-like protein [Lolium perenne]
MTYPETRSQRTRGTDMCAAAWDGPTAGDLKAAGAESIPGGVRVKGWVIQSHKGPILNSASVSLFEDKLQTTHLPEMVFGESSVSLQHPQTGIRLHFNALDALKQWKQEALPPVQVPAAAKWKFRSNPSDQVILDYDYTFTTPYCGSDAVALNQDTMQTGLDECSSLCWEDTDDRIDLVALSAKEPILFYDEVILYEDELADSGISFLTARVRVMPSGWFLLLRFWLRVDGAVMRLRDTRLHCSFGSKEGAKPVVLRELCWREATFAAMSAEGYPSDSAAYADPSLVARKLPVVMQKTQKLKVPS